MRINVISILIIVFSLSIFTLGLLEVSGIYPWAPEFNETRFLNLPSLFILLGGLMNYAAVTRPPKDFLIILRAIGIYFSHGRNDRAEHKRSIDTIISWQNMLKKDRLDSLTVLSRKYRNSFEGYVFSLILTNYSYDEVKILGELEIDSRYRNTAAGSQILSQLGNASPAFGMLGTLIGLISMMNYFEDPLQLAAGLTVALMTTLYGLVLAQFLWYPLSNKLKNYAQIEAYRNKIYLEGIILIAKNRPPLYIKDYLRALIKSEV